jgi:hypothetical protein
MLELGRGSSTLAHSDDSKILGGLVKKAFRCSGHMRGKLIQARTAEIYGRRQCAYRSDSRSGAFASIP